jgi:hypothetical protein
MVTIKRVGDRALLNTIEKFPLDIRHDHSKRTFWLGIAVLRHFFGPQWVEENVGFGRTTPGFLRLTSSDIDKAKSETGAYRIVDLAEILLNLQEVPGIDICIEKMKRDDIESTFAELDFGKMLYTSEIDFRFVKPQQKKGSDYDVEIILSDGCVVCADAKCKIEARDFSEETVKNSLHEARKQFPSDRPSVIFMKIPTQWMDARYAKKPLNGIAEHFLRGTGRIVSVKFYVSEVIYRDGAITHNQMFKEISNPNNRFGRNRNWDMFAKPNVIGGWSTVPPRWRRLLFFPERGPA